MNARLILFGIVCLGIFGLTSIVKADVVVVAPVSTPQQNGSALLDAIDNITDASADNPYLVRIEPGIYDLMDQALVMKEFVDIEGSGRRITRITSCGFADRTAGTVVGANNAELRFLNIHNRGLEDCPAGQYAIGLYNDNARPSLFEVSIVASQDQGGPVAYAYGALNVGIFSGAGLRHSSIAARGKPNSLNVGIYNDGVRIHPRAGDSSVIARGGVNATGLLLRSPETVSFLWNLRRVLVHGDARAVYVKSLNVGDSTLPNRLNFFDSQIESAPGGTAIISDENSEVQLVRSDLKASFASKGDGALIRQGAYVTEFGGLGELDSVDYQVVANAGVQLDTLVDGDSWVDIRKKLKIVGEIDPFPPGRPIFTQVLIDTSTGAHLTLSGIWANASDVRNKENRQLVDRRHLLQKLATLPIHTWSHKEDDPAVRHIGPSAQDFHRVFGFGVDDKHVATVDADGLALATIQGLYELSREKDRRIDELRTALQVTEKELATLKTRLKALEDHF